MTRQELEGLIKNVSNRMRSDDNTKLVTKYIEHLSWLLFLKVHEAIEEEQLLLDPSHRAVIAGKYRWSEWTKASWNWRAEDLIDFVNDDLFPYLRALGGSRACELIAAIFSGVTTVMKSGFGLKEVIATIDRIDFHAPQDVHTFSVVYESLLARLGRDGSWSGEFYTPRPIVRCVVDIVNPKLGERIYDPAAGSAGFLAEAFEHLRTGEKTLKDYELLQNQTFFGQENGELPFLLGTMNMILHGVSAPHMVRRNTLEEDIRGVPPDQQYDVILTNPPFGGKETPQIQQNFPAKSGATEVLFLQHVMAHLRQGGRTGIVVPDGILFRVDGAFSHVRQRLVDDFNLTAIIRLPLGTFPYAPDTRTNLLFFSKTAPTSSVRYYQVRTSEGKRSFTKTRPVTDDIVQGAVNWVRDGIADTDAWEVSVDQIRAGNYDLDLIAPDLERQLDTHVAVDRIVALSSVAKRLDGLVDELSQIVSHSHAYRVEHTEALGRFIEPRGPRSAVGTPMKFVGVSNQGGLVPFKGDVAKDESRYRQVTVGDFVYNPMRVNVGSIALCRSEDEEGFASPDYVVFKLKSDAPFGSHYLLHYLQSSMGLRQIQRNAQGTIRSRLYFENLGRILIPVPGNAKAWDELLLVIDASNRLLRDLPEIGSGALRGLVDSLFQTNLATDEINREGHFTANPDQESSHIPLLREQNGLYQLTND